MSPCELLIIDPQNDFLDIEGAALPVPGANADMTRLAAWLQQHRAAVQAVTVTLDSHPSVGIERTSFWLQADGSAAAPSEPVSTAVRMADNVQRAIAAAVRWRAGGRGVLEYSRCAGGRGPSRLCRRGI